MYNIIYNSIITQTPNVNTTPARNPTDTFQTYTPQPSTPIKHAGSDSNRIPTPQPRNIKELKHQKPDTFKT